jgi:hypothetical protein
MKLRTALSTLIASATAFAALAVTPAVADVTDRLYDFTDAHYMQNGINPAKLAGRKQAPSASAVIDTPFYSWQRNVRVIGTSGTYTSNGSIAYFAVMASFGPDGFTNDAAGVRARQIADSYVEWVFPKRGADPVGLGNARQATVVDTDGGYFSNNPLGLWLHVWVNYTDRAFNTRDGQKMLSDLAAKNGLALDGTPIIKTKSDILNLYSKGFVVLLQRNDGLRYAVCPVIKDPRDGGIAPDAFLNTARKPDGSPLDPAFVTNFNSLQTTFDWAD